MMKKPILFIALLLLTFNSFAQKFTFEGSFLEIGMGSKFANTFDEAIQTPHQQGLFGGVNLKFSRVKANFIWWAEIAADAGFYNDYQFPSYQDRSAMHYSGFYNIGYMSSVHKFSNELYLYGGAAFRGRGVYNQITKYTNSQDNYAIFNSFGPSFMLHYTFYGLGKWWNIEWQLTAPIATYYIRPAYAVNTPNESLGISKPAFVPKFYELDSELRFVFPLGNQNKLVLEYTWDFYSLDREIDQNKVQSAAHGIFLNWVYKLDFKQPWGVR